MDVLAFKEAFDAFLFKGCLFALAGLSVVFFMLTCGFRKEIEDFIKKTGSFSSSSFLLGRHGRIYLHSRLKKRRKRF